ncbi:hypothetical protein [Cyanobium sp. NIES-981]|uniref:hypothetical protein n=1 Tax=Cyanobium sp. NIES-981 TaxID=1851505 RepID=UPI0007DCFBF6|nr:hypothetical protein [Cyanobium sp. NIES-981]SBO42183.1 conserved protein of unknown function [Cyanobium sp. NIES-981]
MGLRIVLRAPLRRAIVGTSGRDSVRSRRLRIANKGSIKLLGRNDRISSRYAMELKGIISMGAGHDVITGRRDIRVLGPEADGSGEIITGRGNDVLKSRRRLFLGDSDLDTGKGNDRVMASEIAFNGPFVETGSGDDIIHAKNSMYHDIGWLRMGPGSDLLKVGSWLWLDEGGRVDMDAGNDTVVVNDVLEIDGASLDMGAGDDTVDVRNGGVELDDYNGICKINLGDGNDRFIGFGKVIPNPDSPSADPGSDDRDIILDGGKGVDQMVLPQGIYTVTQNKISSSLGYLPVRNFEVLAGINGNSFPYASGVLTVDSNGLASFAPALA